MYVYYRSKHDGRYLATILLQRLDTLVNGSNTIGQVLPTLTILTTRHHKSSLLDHIPPLSLAGESLNTLNQILIAVSVSSNNLSNQRNSSKTPSLVDEVENRVVDFAELETSEYTTGLQDAESLLQRNILVCKVTDAERDRVQIHTVIRNHVQILRIRLYKVQSSGTVIVGQSCTLATLGEHIRIDVGDCNVCVWVVVYICRVVEDAEGDVAGAACDVEDFPAGLGCAGGVAAGVYAADKVVFPEAVDTEGHEVVHCVVG